MLYSMKNITVQVVGMSVKELDCILILDGVITTSWIILVLMLLDNIHLLLFHPQNIWSKCFKGLLLLCISRAKAGVDMSGCSRVVFSIYNRKSGIDYCYQLLAAFLGSCRSNVWVSRLGQWQLQCFSHQSIPPINGSKIHLVRTIR